MRDSATKIVLKADVEVFLGRRRCGVTLLMSFCLEQGRQSVARCPGRWNFDGAHSVERSREIERREEHIDRCSAASRW